MKKLSILIVVVFCTLAHSQPGEEKASVTKYAAENQALKNTQGRRIVFMGDSITELWKVLDGNLFSSNNYINRGISGQTTPQMLLRFREDVIDLHPEIVVIQGGINDIAQNSGPIPLEDTFGNIVSMAELARSNEIRVVLCSVLPAGDIPWRTGLLPADKIIRLNGMIKTYAEKHKLVYVDYYSKMKDKNSGLKEAYSEDGVHPNFEGYKIMKPLVVKGIAKALKNN
jgi:lysophospholipase L1-like esterase